ncbi:spore photoproduct lyase family protein [Tautonia plasticadhaerens]|uniref:Spore photoproduct lyase n=1 Tax=Tautonia plasticadhaerens TaxID=2527974 RepID=A0A518GWM4_9BACT|nr:spore photoproduct lyase family protein [Tautonia plasticadhaerens]QDV32997.1 Spore photoproduct lyase [Tautonia plasticadhaerens]
MPTASPGPAALLDVGTIYHEPAVPDHPRGREILGRFPHARREVVRSHWNIPGLHGNEGKAEDWLRTKKTTLVLGLRKGMEIRPNGRSADFIAPGASNGCAMACSYCYVPRRKGYANPITTFVNVDAIAAAIRRHADRLGRKEAPNQVDPWFWVYDVGENGDCSVDAAISDNVRDLVALFRDLPNAKASFATKSVNRELLDYDPRGKTRVRFSLMPPVVAKLLDVRTSTIAERIAAIDDFVAAGYEVHLNLSPVVYYEGWLDDYRELFSDVDARIGSKARRQLRAEIIFLTHNDRLHEVNLRWHPRAEELLWVPDLQESKVSETGGTNVRYRRGLKRQLVAEFEALLRETLPYCGIRYAF